MKVALVHENILGHNSYLPAFEEEFRRRGELGIEPHRIDVLPLPRALRQWGDTTVPLLRRWGLDFWFLRWRMAASLNARRRLEALRRTVGIDVVVANTQSVALQLAPVAVAVPVFVGLDATFEMLGRTRWFAPNALSRAALSGSLRLLVARERALYGAASGLLPWSGMVADSLRQEYAIDPGKVHPMPPSIRPPPYRPAREAAGRRQILFMGGDFVRKGGPLVVDCWRRHFSDRCDLHLVTQSPVPVEPGLHVHAGVGAGTEAWRRRWLEADVFVFPSSMETFGIVLLEALGFMVPVVASRAGAAVEILDGGRAGWLVDELRDETLRVAIDEALSGAPEVRARVERGRAVFDARYALPENAARLSRAIHVAYQQRKCARG